MVYVTMPALLGFFLSLLLCLLSFSRTFLFSQLLPYCSACSVPPVLFFLHVSPLRLLCFLGMSLIMTHYGACPWYATMPVLFQDQTYCAARCLNCSFNCVSKEGTLSMPKILLVVTYLYGYQGG